MEIDARGLPCPPPVLKTRQAADSGADELIVTVDNEGAAESVARFGRGCGFETLIEPLGPDYMVWLTRSPEPGVEPRHTAPDSRLLPGRTLLIGADSLGRGSEELGQVLVRAMINALAENDRLPARIILFNSGVKLACEGSALIESLTELTRSGVDLLCCGACLKRFGLMDRLRAGRVSNACEILNAMLDDRIAAGY